MRRPKESVERLFRPLARVSRAVETGGRDDDSVEAIWQVIFTIPRGRVSTYGAVARAAGLPRHARQAGYALRVAPKELNLPWHRVVGAGGRIVFPSASRQYKEQTRLLRAEGVSVKAGRVARSAVTLLDGL